MTRQNWHFTNTSQMKVLRPNKKQNLSGLPCGPLVKTLPSNAGDKSSIPGWETRSHVPWGQKKKKKKDIKQQDYCNKFN